MKHSSEILEPTYNNIEDLKNIIDIAVSNVKTVDKKDINLDLPAYMFYNILPPKVANKLGSPLAAFDTYLTTLWNERGISGDSIIKPAQNPMWSGGFLKELISNPRIFNQIELGNTDAPVLANIATSLKVRLNNNNPTAKYIYDHTHKIVNIHVTPFFNGELPVLQNCTHTTITESLFLKDKYPSKEQIYDKTPNSKEIFVSSLKYSIKELNKFFDFVPHLTTRTAKGELIGCEDLSKNVKIYEIFNFSDHGTTTLNDLKLDIFDSPSLINLKAFCGYKTMESWAKQLDIHYSFIYDMSRWHTVEYNGWSIKFNLHNNKKTQKIWSVSAYKQ